jgi:vacuolar-type H+-ATPase subunit I/STV1
MNPKLVKNSKLYDFFIRYQPEIAIITSLGMIYGFLAGRAILSLSMFLFFLNSIWNTKPAFWAKQKWWLWGLVWLGLYAVSYFWSTDIPYWQERVQVKLPFLIFPIAMANLWFSGFGYMCMHLFSLILF